MLIKDLKINKYTVKITEYEKEYGETFRVYCEKANHYNPFSRTFDDTMASINLLISDKCSDNEKKAAIKKANDWVKENANKDIEDMSPIRVIFQQNANWLI